MSQTERTYDKRELFLVSYFGEEIVTRDIDILEASLRENRKAYISCPEYLVVQRRNSIGEKMRFYYDSNNGVIQMTERWSKAGKKVRNLFVYEENKLLKVENGLFDNPGELDNWVPETILRHDGKNLHITIDGTEEKLPNDGSINIF